MILVLYLTGILIIVFIGGKLYLSLQFYKKVRELFSLSKSISNKRFFQDQLIGLPEPVQRYFQHVLKEGQPYISYVRITHRGQFKKGIDKDWIDIKGEQYATTEKPGFIWKGDTTLFTARDMYLGDRGRLIVSIFSMFNLVDAKGETYDQGELLRWLGESILYPTNLLPDMRLQWLPIDSQSARLVFHYRDLSIYFIVAFNELGEIIQMETKRYMDETRLETWVIKLSNYGKMNDVIVPRRFEVLWRLEEGDFSYAKFTINRIEYNIAERF